MSYKLRENEETKRMRLRKAISGHLLLLLPFNAGLSLMSAEVFPDNGVPWWALFLLGMLLDFAFLWLLSGSKGHLVVPAASAAFIIAALAGFHLLQLSLGNLGNALVNQWIRITGHIHLQFQASGQAVFAMLLLLAFTELLVSLSLQKGVRIIWYLLYVPILLFIAIGSLTDPKAIALLLAAFILSLGTDTNTGTRDLLYRAGLLCVVGLAGMLLLLPLQNTDPEGFYAKLTRTVHEIRYDQDTDSMPEGDLASVGKWNKSDAGALEVTMDNPQKLYLRGKIYNNYTGTAWTRQEVSDPTEDSALFYWLHRYGFYGESQLSLAGTLSAGGTQSAMTIKNVGACRESSYLPYSLSESTELDDTLIGDDVMSAGITSILSSEGSISAWYETQKTLVEHQDEATVKSYLSLESAYREYVKKTDLQLTEACKETLDAQLGGNHEPLTMEEIQGNIYDYLAETMTYEEDVDTMGDETDFLSYVLEENPAGYSVHYATIAVLMLRYYGVPARYVEGYFLSREDAEKLSKGETVTLTENNAHAWAEYYLDGVGFVPFEVTPGYIDEEDLEEGTGAEGANSQYKNSQAKTQDIEQPDVDTEKDEKDGGVFLWLMLLLGVLVLILLLLLLILLRRRGRLKKFLAVIGNADPRESVPLAYAYAMKLRSYGQITLDEDEEAASINTEARFSNHEITEEKKAFMISYMEKSLAALKKQWNIGKRFKLKFLKNLY